MKRCPVCSAVFDDSFAYCNNCGTPSAPAAAEKPSFAKKLGAFGIGVLYILFHFAVQSFTVTLFSIVLVALYIIKNGGIENYGALYDLMANDVMNYIIPITIVSAFITTLCIFLFLRIRKKKPLSQLRLNSSPGIAVLAVIALGLALNFAVSLFQSFTPLPEALIREHNEAYSYLGQGNKIIEFIAIAVLTPIVEEIVFRALCYGSMRRVMSFTGAAVLSAVVFGIAHGNIISFVYTSVLGFLIAYLYEKSGSLWVPIALHFGFNAGSYLVSLLPTEAELLFFAVIFFISAVLSVMLGMITVNAYSKKYALTH